MNNLNLTVLIAILFSILILVIGITLLIVGVYIGKKGTAYYNKNKCDIAKTLNNISADIQIVAQIICLLAASINLVLLCVIKFI